LHLGSVASAFYFFPGRWTRKVGKREKERNNLLVLAFCLFVFFDDGCVTRSIDGDARIENE